MTIGLQRILGVGHRELPALVLQDHAYNWLRAGSIGHSEMDLKSSDLLGDKRPLNEAREALNNAIV